MTYSCYPYLCHGNRSHMRTYGLRVVTEPTIEPISLDEARLHLRLDSYGSPAEHADDPWIEATLPAAREWCEFYSGRSLAPQVIEMALQEFPHAWHTCFWADDVKLPMGPIAGVESVIYTDADGVAQTIDTADYIVDVTSDIGYVYPLVNTSWPSTLSRPNAVRIRYHAGFTTDSYSPNDMPLPKAYRSAILLVLGHLYENRENTTDLKLDTLPLGAQALLDRGRLRLGAW